MQLVNLIKDNSSKNVVLLGPGGSGKTMQLINLFKALLKENNIIPIYITLSSFDDTKDYLLSQFVLEYTQYGIKKDDNLKFVLRDFFRNSNAERFVFILDAVNETSSAYIEYVYDEINFLAAFDNVQVVMACRYDMKPSEKLFSTCRLLPLDEKKVNEGIVNYTNMNKEMKELLRLPMFYSIYVEMGIDERKVLTQEELLENYFEFVIRKIIRDDTKTNRSFTYQRIFKKLLFSFLPLYIFGKQMSRRNYMILDDELIEDWEIYKAKYGINIDKSIISVLQDLGIIEEVSGHDHFSIWKFSHESYFDYFIFKAFQNIRNENSVEQCIDFMTKITFFYDEKGDREKTYKYGKMSLEQFGKASNVRSADLALKLARGYIECGYAVLHYKNPKSDYLECSYKALSDAEDILRKVANDGLVNSENIQEYNRIKTALNGNYGAYYYEAGDYQAAMKYHMQSMEERKNFFSCSEGKIKEYWELKLATAFKNVASDWYKLSECGKEDKYSYLEIAISNHKIAYRIYKEYKDIYPIINKDLIVCINRMVGCIVPFLEMETFSSVETIYGNNLGEIIGNILIDLLWILEYYKSNIINFNEIDDSLLKIRTLLHIAKERNVSNNNVDYFFSEFSKIKYQNEYLNNEISNILEEANND